jgi:hypothetical protein
MYGIGLVKPAQRCLIRRLVGLGLCSEDAGDVAAVQVRPDYIALLACVLVKADVVPGLRYLQDVVCLP